MIPKGQTTVREALQGCYDIKKATPATLSMIRQHITPLLPPHHHNALLRPLSSKEECASYLEGRRLAQVLADCCGPRLPQAPPVDTVFSLLATLRPLQPRYYSISSSPLLTENQLSLTVAVVRYREEGGMEEEGVATTYLQDRMDIGQSLPVFVTVNPDFRLPPSPTTPILLISAGTGIAPFMAFVQDRGKSAKDFKPSLLDAVCVLKQSWDKVTPATIANSFGKAGFIKSDGADDTLNYHNPKDHEEQEPLLARLFAEWNIDPSEYVSVDDDVATEEPATCASAPSTSTDTVDEEASDEEDNCGKGLERISTNSALDCVEKLKKFCLQSGCSDDIMKRWEARGLMRARVAFSRHQGRVYVQDLLKQDAALVWTLMEEAGVVVYVCGDAGRFAPDVEEMLIWIIQQQGQRSLDEAHSYLTQLQNAARYQKDAWLS
ncbi:hypothetical protein ACOMHN_035611 [Nucella lapillus]